jgi:hypothetical protein
VVHQVLEDPITQRCGDLGRDTWVGPAGPSGDWLDRESVFWGLGWSGAEGLTRNGRHVGHLHRARKVWARSSDPAATGLVTAVCIRQSAPGDWNASD